MKAADVISIIEEVAPYDIQESWDNSGLALGDTQKEVEKVLLALDCTPEVIEEAISTGADMIITHHPLLFKGVKRISTETCLERMITRIIKNDLVVYSAHTNMDKVLCGVSGLMAERLGLVNVRILEKELSGEFGLGVIGDFVKPMDNYHVIEIVKEHFHLSVLRSSKACTIPVKTVALCGGSGANLIDTARKEGAQLLITGDVKYHDFFCEEGFMIMDIGHFESENGVLEFIKDILTKKISNFAVRIAERNINPIHYY